MDYQSLLLDPNYLVLGVDATLSFSTGESFGLTAIDKTSGIDLGDAAQVQTIIPAAVIRVAELTSLGIGVERLAEEDTKITINSLIWTVESHRLRPTPNGEGDGEVYLLLSEKTKGKQTMSPAVYDFEIVRGSTTPFTISLVTTDDDGNETPILFDDIRLSVYTDGELLYRKTFADGDFIADSANDVTWEPTTADSRAIPLGPNTSYELEVRFESHQEVYMLGTITGIGGLNDD